MRGGEGYHNLTQRIPFTQTPFARSRSFEREGYTGKETVARLNPHSQIAAPLSLCSLWKRGDGGGRGNAERRHLFSLESLLGKRQLTDVRREKIKKGQGRKMDPT